MSAGDEVQSDCDVTMNSYITSDIFCTKFSAYVN